MLKRLIHRVFNKLGYQVSKISTVERKIELGYYKWLQEYGINTIIDVGANNGGFASMINKIIPEAHIYSFEPLERCFKELKEKTLHIKKITCFNYALGESEKETVFYENEFSPSSSILEIKDQHIRSFPYTAKTSPQIMPLKTLDSFSEHFKLKPKTLLKLDVQGYELNVFKGAAKILSSVDIIFTEVSFIELYERQPLFHDIYQYLTNCGFKYQGNFEQLNDPDSNLGLQADAIFIRDKK